VGRDEPPAVFSFTLISKTIDKSRNTIVLKCVSRSKTGLETSWYDIKERE
jgi:hypothetical protein